MGDRIAIIGNAGGGKSTMARHLSRARKLLLYQLDPLQWNPGWIATPEKEFDQRHDELIRQDRWILDGFAS